LTVCFACSLRLQHHSQSLPQDHHHLRMLLWQLHQRSSIPQHLHRQLLPFSARRTLSSRLQSETRRDQSTSLPLRPTSMTSSPDSFQKKELAYTRLAGRRKAKEREELDLKARAWKRRCRFHKESRRMASAWSGRRNWRIESLQSSPARIMDQKSCVAPSAPFESHIDSADHNPYHSMKQLHSIMIGCYTCVDDAMKVTFLG
jgi:hypothetical protein